MPLVQRIIDHGERLESIEDWIRHQFVAFSNLCAAYNSLKEQIREQQQEIAAAKDQDARRSVEMEELRWQISDLLYQVREEHYACKENYTKLSDKIAALDLAVDARRNAAESAWGVEKVMWKLQAWAVKKRRSLPWLCRRREQKQPIQPSGVFESFV